MTRNGVHEGRCSCGKLRYRMNADPLIVHACHCRQCQRVAGSAFVMNAVVDKDALEIRSGETARFRFPDTCHTAFFCPDCATYVWSEYARPGGYFGTCWFLRVGAMDEPDRLAPDVHIYTSSKQPWVPIPRGVPAFEAFYRIKDVWRRSSIARMPPDWRARAAS
jgi:hypothetical protein